MGKHGLIAFDFDQTICVNHVFHLINGAVPKRIGTPQGFLKYLPEDLVGLENAKNKNKVPAAVLEFLGGAERVARLHALFKGLQADGHDLVVISRGVIPAILRAADQRIILPSNCCLKHLSPQCVGGSVCPQGTRFNVQFL